MGLDSSFVNSSGFADFQSNNLERSNLFLYVCSLYISVLSVLTIWVSIIKFAYLDLCISDSVL